MLPNQEATNPADLALADILLLISRYYAHAAQVDHWATTLTIRQARRTVPTLRLWALRTVLVAANLMHTYETLTSQAPLQLYSFAFGLLDPEIIKKC